MTRTTCDRLGAAPTPRISIASPGARGKALRQRIIPVGVLAVILLAAPLTREARAQAIPEASLVGRWTHQTGVSTVTFDVRKDATYTVNYRDIHGQSYTDSGRYTYFGGSLYTRNRAGFSEKVAVVWNNPDQAEFWLKLTPNAPPIQTIFTRQR